MRSIGMYKKRMTASDILRQQDEIVLIEAKARQKIIDEALQPVVDKMQEIIDE